MIEIPKKELIEKFKKVFGQGYNLGVKHGKQKQKMLTDYDYERLRIDFENYKKHSYADQKNAFEQGYHQGRESGLEENDNKS